MKKFILFIAALFVLSILNDLFLHSDEKPEPVAVDKPKAVGAEFYAGRPTQYTWPTATQSAPAYAGSVLAQNYYLVLDGSGSMEASGCSDGRSKIDAAKTAVAQFISQIPAEANVGLLAFDNYGIGERVSLGSNHLAVKQQVQQITVGGSTPLFSAMSMAYKAMNLQAQKQFGYGEYHMIVVTDGEADQGEDPRRIVSKILAESPITLHTIGFCIGSGHSLNVPGITNYRAANNPKELLAGLQNVLAESSSYVVDNFDEANGTR